MVQSAKEYKELFFKPYAMVTLEEFEAITDTNEAISLIDTEQVNENNYNFVVSLFGAKNYSNNELLDLFNWLFLKENNPYCISEKLLISTIFKAIDFNSLNLKRFSEEEREQIHSLFSDSTISYTSEQSLEFLERYGCLVCSLEETLTSDSDYDIVYSRLISKYDEFTSYTIKWLEENYIHCGLSKKLCNKLYDVQDYQNYIIADCLSENNMIIDNAIPFKAYFDVYIKVDEIYSLMSNHWEFLEKVQELGDYSKLEEKHLIPIFKTRQIEKFFKYVFSDAIDVALKEKYLREFGKFKEEKDSKAFQKLMCQDENMELLGDYDLYHRIRYQLWETNRSHKGQFTKAWNARWKKELDDKAIVTLD